MSGEADDRSGAFKLRLRRCLGFDWFEIVVVVVAVEVVLVVVVVAVMGGLLLLPLLPFS
jgi:hypothetical protein